MTTAPPPDGDEDGQRPASDGVAVAPEPPPEPPLRSGRRLRTFDSLIDVPPFRWYLVSSTGNFSALQMQQVARSFLAYYITGSFAALGFVELANTVPRLFLALYGGVLADRISRRIIIQVGQSVNAFLAAAIAALLFADQLRIEHLVLAAFCQGVLNSFVMPARQSMIPEIVGPTRLMNAFALNVFMLNVMRLGAPALAGAMIAAVGPSWVFMAMVGLNVFAVVALFPVPRTNAATRAAARGGTADGGNATPRRRDRLGLNDIKDAFRYIGREKVILWLMVIHSSTQMLSLPYQRLLSGFVDTVLSSSPEETAIRMGLLLSVTAIGALGGSLLIASLPDRRRGKLLIFSLGLFGVTMIAFAASEVLLISIGVVLVLGVGQSMRQSIANILIQSRLQDEFRGRVNAIMLLDDGLESLGVFGIAMIADLAGPQMAFGGVGLIMILYGAVLWIAKPIRDLD